MSGRRRKRPERTNDQTKEWKKREKKGEKRPDFPRAKRKQEKSRGENERDARDRFEAGPLTAAALTERLSKSEKQRARFNSWERR
jgi:hypothetical protein